MIKFSFQITTKNRLEDLKVTLNTLLPFIKNNDFEVVVIDDASTDGTSDFINENYPEIKLKRNSASLGLIANRNWMLNNTTAQYAISLDDDANFLTENPLEIIQSYFEQNTNCGLVALRVFWGLDKPNSKRSAEKPSRVQGFVGCGHIWRMSAWNSIPDYPAWFVFYGEEDFASYQLFKKNIEIHYLPQVLVHHRVDVKSRRNNADYTLRLRRSLRSGWYLYFLFFPLQNVPRKMAYSIWMQLKLKVFKGDMRALQAIALAMFDLVMSIQKIIKNSNRLTNKQYKEYQKLAETKLYWKPED
jgi:glycosyltransferase involved in cell wall biosynthesis